MNSKIIILYNDGNFSDEVAYYSLPPSEAVKCYYYQHYLHNYNTWEYKDIGVKNDMFTTPNGDVIKAIISNE